MINKSNTIACLIVDDEISSQKVMQYFIEETEILELKGICNNASEAFAFLKKHPETDLIFLDINMPQLSGLDFYKSLKSPPKVIFTTAHPQFAVEGFEVNATDYLLKPVAFKRFLAAVEKVASQISNTNGNQEFMVLKENKTLHKIIIDSIVYIEAFGDYVKVHTMEKTIVTHSTFSKFLESLPDNFLRIHKSFSINLNHMNELSGNQIVIGNKKVPIGQTYKQDVLKALNL